MSITDLLNNEYQTYLAKDHGKITCWLYRLVGHQLCTGLGITTLEQVRDITPEQVTNYLEEWEEAETSRKDRVQALNCFFTYLHSKGHLPKPIKITEE